MVEEAQTADEVTAPSPVVPASSRGRWRSWLAWGLVLAFLGVMGWGLLNAQAGQLDRGPAPDFSLNLYRGGTFRLSEQRGKVVMIDFWASWCVPCRQEAPALEGLWQEYRDRDVVFVGVAYADTETAATLFLDEFGITYPNGPDLGTRISDAYRMKGVPEKFFIDRQGQIRAVIIGPASEAEYRRQLEMLLAEP